MRASSSPLLVRVGLLLVRLFLGFVHLSPSQTQDLTDLSDLHVRVLFLHLLIVHLMRALLDYSINSTLVRTFDTDIEDMQWEYSSMKTAARIGPSRYCDSVRIKNIFSEKIL